MICDHFVKLLSELAEIVSIGLICGLFRVFQKPLPKWQLVKQFTSVYRLDHPKWQLRYLTLIFTITAKQTLIPNAIINFCLFNATLLFYYTWHSMTIEVVVFFFWNATCKSVKQIFHRWRWNILRCFQPQRVRSLQQQVSQILTILQRRKQVTLRILTLWCDEL